MLVDGGTDLIGDRGHLLLELFGVAPREGLHAFKRVEVQLSVRLLEQIVECRQEYSQVSKWNLSSRHVLWIFQTGLIDSNHGEAFKGCISSKFVTEAF